MQFITIKTKTQEIEVNREAVGVIEKPKKRKLMNSWYFQFSVHGVIYKIELTNKELIEKQYNLLTCRT